MKKEYFTKVFSTSYFSIEESDYVFSGGEPYYRFCHPDSAMICTINEAGDFVLVRQFRPNLGCYTIEFPAGAVDQGEKPLDTAYREFHEETGMECELREVGQYRVMMNRTQNLEYVFFGINAVQTVGGKHEADIEVLQMPRREFVDAVLSCEFQQLTALGVLQIASLRMGVDVVNGEVNEIVGKFQGLRS